LKASYQEKLVARKLHTKVKANRKILKKLKIGYKSFQKLLKALLALKTPF
jgi:hypothetical protein